MKKIIASLILPILLSTASFAGLTSLLTSEHRDWNFVQSVGGIAVADPIIKGNKTIWLPIICNVSGLENITVKPTMVNSALVVRKLEYKVENDKILIYLETSLIDDQNKDVKTKGVLLENIKPGVYRVEYLNPDKSSHFIREIKVD